MNVLPLVMQTRPAGRSQPESASGNLSNIATCLCDELAQQRGHLEGG